MKSSFLQIGINGSRAVLPGERASHFGCSIFKEERRTEEDVKKKKKKDSNAKFDISNQGRAMNALNCSIPNLVFRATSGLSITEAPSDEPSSLTSAAVLTHSQNVTVLYNKIDCFMVEPGS